MTPKQLAAELRGRLIGLVPVVVLAETEDMDIIESYVECAECGYVAVEGPALEAAIRSARIAHEFLDAILPTCHVAKSDVGL